MSTLIGTKVVLGISYLVPFVESYCAVSNLNVAISALFRLGSYTCSNQILVVRHQLYRNHTCIYYKIVCFRGYTYIPNFQLLYELHYQKLCSFMSFATTDWISFMSFTTINFEFFKMLAIISMISHPNTEAPSQT